MHLKLATSFLAITSVVSASALPGDNHHEKGHGSHDTISQAEAERFINRFFRFMQTGDRDLAEELLTPDVKGYSASTWSINGFDPPPRGTPWMEGIDGFVARNGYLDEQSTKYDYFVAVGSGIHKHDIFWAWQFDGIPPLRLVPSSGHVCFSLRKVRGKWKAWRESWENDNIAWARNYGVGNGTVED